MCRLERSKPEMDFSSAKWWAEMVRQNHTLMYIVVLSFTKNTHICLKESSLIDINSIEID